MTILNPGVVGVHRLTLNHMLLLLQSQLLEGLIPLNLGGSHTQHGGFAPASQGSTGVLYCDGAGYTIVFETSVQFYCIKCTIRQ